MAEHQQQLPLNHDFTNEQRAELTDLIAQAVTAAMVIQQAGNNGSNSGNTGNDVNNPSTGSSGTNGHNTFQAKDISYFDPQVNTNEDVVVKD